MKILLWPTSFFPYVGGLEKAVYSLAQAFLSQGHEVLVITNAKTFKSYEIDNIQVRTLPFNDALFQYNLLLMKQVIAQTVQIIESFAPEVINLHGWYESFAFYQMRVLKNIETPICLTIHGFLEQENYTKDNCLKLWQKAAAINVVSNCLSPPMPHANFKVIYNGLPSTDAQLRPLPKNRLLLAGRLSSEKGFPIAFYAFKLLLQKHPDLTLTLIGEGPEKTPLEQLAKDLNLTVNMPGLVPPHEVFQYIDDATLVLIPSTYESFCLVALEAALRERPVVASAVMGLKEVIEDGVTGILVDPNDPEKLASAVSDLLEDPIRMEFLGISARKRALNLFHINSTANQYLDLYEQASRLRHHSGA